MALPLIIQHLCFLFVLALPLLVSSQNANVSLGSSLAASEDNSWKSLSGDFAIGFRTTGNEELFLLAIWFDKIPEKTIVWYANGDKPAPKGSRLELTGDADFRLVDPKGQEIWKPESISAEIAYAAMLDSGNFVLVDRNSEYLWESFKGPKDTILPTQELAIGGKLSSRKTEKDYSKGRFRLLMQTGGNLVLNSIALPTDFAYPAYFKSNTSDAADEMNSGYLFVFNTTGYLSIILRNRTSVSVTKKAVPQGDYYHRATLDPDGIFAQYAHTRSGSGEQNWFRIWSAPDDICLEINGDLGIGPCGFNSLCSLDANQRPDCECIPGFSLSHKSDKFSGCKQDRMLNCDQGNSKPEDLYEMHGLPNAYWPTSANYEQMPQLNEQDCNISCLYDCNCLVAVIKDGNCWKKKLPLSNGRRDYKPYGKALIKVPKSDIPSNEPSSESNIGKKDQATLVLVGALLLGSSVFLNFLFVAAISLAILYVYPRRQNLVGPSSILETNLRAFTFKELKESTDGFREELGRGAFGTVFKGVLSSATTTSKYYVAVKKLDKVWQEGEREFKTEASAIAKTHHKNLVKLLGFCDENEHKLLVYEFMSNGTLASFLFGISRPDWNKRVQIALGIARGLTYLHEECSTQIIHCDIKPQNILLEESFTARISDFGLAKLMMSDQTRTQTVIRGTRGYVAPEWFRNTPITAKVDVYSYGVMLLEIICCRKSLAMEMENEEEVILTDWAYDCYKEGILNKLVENDEEARNDMKRAERLVMVAIWCIQEDPSLRPSMRMVTQMLEGVVQVSIPPCPSPFSSIC